MYLSLISAFIWSLVVALFSVPSIIHIAHSKKLLDEPNHRTVHANLTPRLGGLAIFAGFMSAVTMFGEFEAGVQHLMAGCILIFFIGIKDDVISISAFKKFFIQVIATFVVMFLGDIRITSLQGFLGIHELEAGMSYAFTFLVIVGVTNAINLIDGLDGLAGSIILFISFAFGTYFYFYAPGYAYVAFCLAGGVLGFLRYNAYKARIFMGDTGSLVAGFTLAVLAVKFVELKTISAAPATVVAILFIPIFDTLRAFGLRIANGRSPFHPDKNHLHHRLLAMNLPQPMVVVVLLLLNSLVLVGTLWFVGYGNTILLSAQVGVAVLASIILEIHKRKLAYA